MNRQPYHPQFQGNQKDYHHGYFGTHERNNRHDRFEGHTKHYTPFQKNVGEIIGQVLMSTIEEKIEKLKKYQSNDHAALQMIAKSSIDFSPKDMIDAQVQQQNVRNIRGKTKIEFKGKIHPHMDPEFLMMHPGMHPRMHPGMFPQQFYGRFHQQGSLKAIQYNIECQIRQLQQQVNNFDLNTKFTTIQPLKLKIKNHFTNDMTMLKRQVENQYKRIKSLRSNNLEEMISIFDNNSLDKHLKQLQQKIKSVFQKFKQTIEKVKSYHLAALQTLKTNLNNKKVSYFDYTRTKLIKITIHQKLPIFEGINTEIFKENKIKVQQAPVNVSDIASKYKIMFNQKSFSGLRETGWLHNSVIDNYIYYLRETRGYNNPDRSDCAIYTSSQASLFDRPQNYRFPQGPIFTRYKRVGLVVNQNNDHWFFIGVFRDTTKIVIYDSIIKASYKYNEYCQNLRKFIKREQKHFNVDNSFQYNQNDQNTTPKQTNGADCGVHVIRNITHFAQGKFEQDFIINFKTHQNNDVRMALYHFMIYLFNVSRVKQLNIKYDWLEYASKSAISKPRKNILWKNP